MKYKIEKVILLCFLSAIAFAKQHDHEVDWSAGIITSYSQASFKTNSEGIPIDDIDIKQTTINRGRNEAYKQAKIAALNNMSNTIMNIKIDGNTKIKDLVESNNEFNQQLSYMLDFEVKEKSCPVDFFSSKCELTLPLGQIINILPGKFPKDDFPAFAHIPISTNYTSLIVDTRGQQIFPTILPAIYDRDGLEIYNRYFVDIRYGIKTGLVSYVFNEKDAFNHPKAGEHPYFTTSMKNMDNCPILNHEDIKRIYSSPKTLAELKKCKVIFIIDRGK
jgi:hypothetical protein